VEDGKYLTGAGVSARIDTALYLAARLTSDDLARTVHLAIEYNAHPRHGGIDWSQVDRDSFAARVQAFAHEALDAPRDTEPASQMTPTPRLPRRRPPQ
jgi:transcriptional regulator GlxA family with amidase domain